MFRAGVGEAVRDSFSQERTSRAEFWFEGDAYTFLLPAFTKGLDNSPHLARECVNKRRRNGNLPWNNWSTQWEWAEVHFLVPVREACVAFVLCAPSASSCSPLHLHIIVSI